MKVLPLAEREPRERNTRPADLAAIPGIEIVKNESPACCVCGRISQVSPGIKHPERHYCHSFADCVARLKEQEKIRMSEVK
jgi:cobalamin-dependent methionine synthase I